MYRRWILSDLTEFWDKTSLILAPQSINFSLPFNSTLIWEVNVTNPLNSKQATPLVAAARLQPASGRVRIC